jgi:outer membrane protein assembly factor BamA
MTIKSACLVLLCAAAVPCSAQHKRAATAPAADTAPAPTPAPSPSDKVKVDKINYTGTGAADYAQSDFAAATGLSAGMITQGDIQNGADALANSGQFGDVSYAMDGDTLVYKIAAAPHVLPVHFENFAWWSDIDLLRDIHAKCPLFVGTLAGKGQLQQQVQDTLTAMATEKAGMPAKVELTLVTKPGQPPYAVGFSITTPPIKIARVELAHGSLDMSSQIAEISHRLEGELYNRDSAREFLTTHLAEAYAASGYIDFAIKQFQATDPKTLGNGFGVTVQGNLEAGALYHVSAVSWTDTPQMNKAAFDSADALKVGDVAARGPLQTTLHNIERVYQLQGFVNAKATATPTLDHDKATVSYVFSVEPGTEFHTD